MRRNRGFWVMATEAPSVRFGGVAIFYREAEHFSVEELRLHGPNVIGFRLVMGRRRWRVVGLYIAPINASTIEDQGSTLRGRAPGGRRPQCQSRGSGRHTTG